jgi:hypothetical protein
MKNIILILSFCVAFTSANAQWNTVYPNNTANSGVELYNGSGGTIGVSVSSCYGCYGGQAKPGDGVIRTLGGGDLMLNIPSSWAQGRKIIFSADFAKFMQIEDNGKITIGNPGNMNGNYKLYVETGIITEKLKIATVNNWADYVFDKKYKLLSLNEVDKFIQINKHLPNVPSAEEVAKEGIDMAKMDAKLLEKIEELTLYVIQLNKKIEQLEKDNKATKKKID